jgi:hypothetical protein
MWSEFVPMSIAAMRMSVAPAGRGR